MQKRKASASLKQEFASGMPTSMLSETDLLASVRILPISAKDTIPLRHSVLWPHAPIEHVYLPDDESGHHYGVFLPSQRGPIAVISVFLEPIPHMVPSDHQNDGNSAISYRFRKFACSPQYQGRGVGTRLLNYVFSVARSGVEASVIWCDARRETSAWYERRGMVAFGEPFWKGPVEYVRMKLKP